LAYFSGVLCGFGIEDQTPWRGIEWFKGEGRGDRGRPPDRMMKGRSGRMSGSTRKGTRAVRSASGFDTDLVACDDGVSAAERLHRRLGSEMFSARRCIFVHKDEAAGEFVEDRLHRFAKEGGSLSLMRVEE